MPQINPAALNPAVLNGTKLFKDKLTVRRTTNKVTRLSRELNSARAALGTAETRFARSYQNANTDTREVALAVEAAYFADR